MKPALPLAFRATAAAVASLIITLLAFVCFTALEALLNSEGMQLWGFVWDPRRGRYGIAFLAYNTFALALIATLICALLSRGLWLILRTGPVWARLSTRVLLRLCAAVPTVVWGFWALFTLVPIIRRALGGSGLSLFTAALPLALQGLSAQVSLIDQAGELLAEQVHEPCMALGLVAEEEAHYVLAPALRPAFYESWVIGFGRAAGDALIPLMVAGGALQPAFSPLKSGRTLASHMSLALSSEVTGGEHRSILVAAFLLLLCSAALSFLSRRIRKHLS